MYIIYFEPLKVYNNNIDIKLAQINHGSYYIIRVDIINNYSSIISVLLKSIGTILTKSVSQTTVVFVLKKLKLLFNLKKCIFVIAIFRQDKIILLYCTLDYTHRPIN